ncbi:MAG: hypothetical protein Q9217_003597 [Psora testacea]
MPHSSIRQQAVEASINTIHQLAAVMSVKTIWRSSTRLTRQSIISPGPYRCLSCSLRLARDQGKQDASTTTHFGFEDVPESEKASRVGKVFTSVATSYDTMNDLMSFGVHRLWKDTFVRTLNPGSPSHPQTILDVAGGTGDIALRILEHATKVNADTRSRVIVSDVNPEMLTEGRKRMKKTEYAESGRLEFLEANAEEFGTIEDAAIDLYTVAFGIRNFTSIPTTLRTAYRTLKPGGVFACLEFSKVGNPLLNSLYKRWSFGAIPLIGQLVAGDRDSYQYLVESIERFPSQETFETMIREAGFLMPNQGREEQGKGWMNLTGGVAAIHIAVKPL